MGIWHDNLGIVLLLIDAFRGIWVQLKGMPRRSERIARVVDLMLLDRSGVLWGATSFSGSAFHSGLQIESECVN